MSTATLPVALACAPNLLRVCIIWPSLYTYIHTTGTRVVPLSTQIWKHARLKAWAGSGLVVFAYVGGSLWQRQASLITRINSSRGSVLQAD
jgi:hypothetical protein